MSVTASLFSCGSYYDADCFCVCSFGTRSYSSYGLSFSCRIFLYLPRAIFGFREKDLRWNIFREPVHVFHIRAPGDVVLLDVVRLSSFSHPPSPFRYQPYGFFLDIPRPTCYYSFKVTQHRYSNTRCRRNESDRVNSAHCGVQAALFSSFFRSPLLRSVIKEKTSFLSKNLRLLSRCRRSDAVPRFISWGGLREAFFVVSDLVPSRCFSPVKGEGSN
jgi:hypothetical protein